MLLHEAKRILKKNGYRLVEETSLKYDFNELSNILNLLFMDGNGEIKESSNNGKIWKFVLGDSDYDVNFIFEYDSDTDVLTGSVNYSSKEHVLTINEFTEQFEYDSEMPEKYTCDYDLNPTGKLKTFINDLNDLWQTGFSW